MLCPNCETETAPGAQFCGACGARLQLACSNCGATNPPKNRFCQECGSVLVGKASRQLTPDRYTPSHLAERILTSRAAMEGERKQVTVLFADLKGSMELLAGQDPEDARAVLDPILNKMMEAVHRYDGTVNQVMGDGIMALFGAPLALEDHAVRACYAALRMQETVDRFSRDIAGLGGTRLQIRIGLNSGEVLVRSVGSDLRMDYTAVGQTTHLAARMEQMAAPGSILLAPGTVDLVEGYVQVKPLGPQPVKGLAAPVATFELIGANPVRSRLQASVARGLTSFVGRDVELSELEDALGRVRSGHGQVLAVVGEPGVGKSRLFREFTQSGRTEGCFVLEATSVSFGKASPWLPVIDLLKNYFRLEPQDDVPAIREKVAGKLRSLDEALEPALAAFLWLVDAASDDDEWNKLDPPQRRRKLLAGIQELLLRESRVQPLVVVFEDLHWIDDETQALLDGLVEKLPASRILLLVNYRHEYLHRNWRRKPWHRELRVEPLRERDADEILDTILGTDSSQAALRPLLIERTDGNPFFLEESVRTLVETGALIGSRGSYRLVGEPDALRIPPTVQAILAARIDRLDPEERSTLQTAAVIGRDVPLVLLQAVAGIGGDALDAVLGRLQVSDFLYESRLFPDLEFTFRHALTQEAAYRGMLNEQCRALHSKVVDAIEQVYASRLDEHVERLAHHSVRAETWASALRYCRQSGKRAIAHSANRYAAAYLKQAIAALQHLPQSMDLLEQAIDIRLELRGALNALDEMAEVYRFLSEASVLADTKGDTRRQALIAALLTQSLDMLGKHKEAAESARTALTIAEPLGDTEIALVANYMLSQALWHLGQLGPATQALKRGLELVPSDVRHMPFGMVTYPAAVVHAALTSRLAELGEFSQAQVHATESIERARQLDHAYTSVFAWLSVGYFHARRGESDAAIPFLERAVDLCRVAEIRRQVVPCASVLCYSYALSGRLDKARELLEQMVEAAVGGWSATATWLPWLAEAALLCGRAAEALRIIERASSIAADRKERASSALVLRLRGDLALRAGSLDADAAGRHYREALDLAEELGLRPLQAHCHAGLNRLCKAVGRADLADKHEALAEEMVREMGMCFQLDFANGPR